MSDTDPGQRLIDALRLSAWPRSTAALAAATGLPQRSVVKVLDRLISQGAVERTRRGEYRMPDADG